MLSSKCGCMSSTVTARIIEPKPSTVPMRVSDAIVGAGHALAQQILRLRDVRERPRATTRAARRGSRCRTVRGAPAATPRSRARGTSCAATRTRRRRCSRRGSARRPAIERLGDVVGRQQLRLGPVQLQVRSSAVSVNSRVTSMATEPITCPDPARSGPPPGDPAGRGRGVRARRLRRDLDGGDRRHRRRHAS